MLTECLIFYTFKCCKTAGKYHKSSSRLSYLIKGTQAVHVLTRFLICNKTRPQCSYEQVSKKKFCAEWPRKITVQTIDSFVAKSIFL